MISKLKGRSPSPDKKAMTPAKLFLCPAEDCETQFKYERNMRIHLKSLHGWSHYQVQDHVTNIPMKSLTTDVCTPSSGNKKMSSLDTTLEGVSPLPEVEEINETLDTTLTPRDDANATNLDCTDVITEELATAAITAVELPTVDVPVDANELYCPVAMCEAKFVLLETLHRHLSKKHNWDSIRVSSCKAYKCPFQGCKVRSVDKLALYTHFTQSHGDEAAVLDAERNQYEKSNTNVTCEQESNRMNQKVKPTIQLKPYELEKKISSDSDFESSKPNVAVKSVSRPQKNLTQPKPVELSKKISSDSDFEIPKKIVHHGKRKRESDHITQKSKKIKVPDEVKPRRQSLFDLDFSETETNISSEQSEKSEDVSLEHFLPNAAESKLCV